MTDAELQEKLEGVETLRRMVRNGEFWEMPAQRADRLMLDLLDTMESYARRLHAQAVQLREAAMQSRKSIDAMQQLLEVHGASGTRPN